MAEARSRFGGIGRITKAFLLLLGVLGLGVLVVKVTGALALQRHAAFGALAGAQHPDLIFRQAGEQLVRNRGRVDDQLLARAVAVAHDRPLAAEPFVFAGLRALQAGNLAGAERAFLEARRRNPRQRLARLMMVGVYLSQNKVAEGSSEIAAVVRLVPRAGEVLVPELARLALDPRAADAVVEAVGADPLMGQVLERLAAQGAQPEVLMRLAARQPRLPSGAFAPWQERLVRRLTETGDVVRARSLWLRFVGAGDRRPLVYDANFAGAAGPPPFNWSLVSSNVGVAERVRGPALEAQFFGRVAGQLATQLLMLPPGRYRLSFQAEGSANGQGSRLAWQVVCREGGAPLLDLPIRDVNYTPRDFAGEFAVPASGCAAQWLQLVGIAAEFPSTQTARITGLALRPAGSAR